jgi:nucleotide-binding universal stress UspA family protein
MSRSVIVVGVDGSRSGLRAMTWAAQEALRRGSALELVTTWGLDQSELGPSQAGAAEAEHLEHAAEALQQEAVDAVLAGMDPRPEVARVVTQSSPVDALITASRTADLIVVGTHGRGPVRTFLFGSVAQALLRHSHCPVVVIPPSMIDGTSPDAEEAEEAG